MEKNKKFIKMISLLSLTVLLGLVALTGCEMESISVSGVEDGKVYFSALNPEIIAGDEVNITLNGEPYDGREIVQSGDYTLTVGEEKYRFTVVNQGAYIWDFADGILDPLAWEFAESMENNVQVNDGILELTTGSGSWHDFNIKTSQPLSDVSADSWQVVVDLKDTDTKLRTDLALSPFSQVDENISPLDEEQGVIVRLDNYGSNITKTSVYLRGQNTGNEKEKKYFVEYNGIFDKVILTLNPENIEVEFVGEADYDNEDIIGDDVEKINDLKIKVPHNFNFEQWSNDPYFHINPMSINNDGNPTLYIEQIEAGKLMEN